VTTRKASSARPFGFARDRTPRSWRPTLPLAETIEPQVSRRLTALAQLRLARSRARTRVRVGAGRRPFGRRHLAAALSTTCEVDELPLTLRVVPRARTGFRPAAPRSAPRTAPTPRSSKRDASSIRSAFHRRMPSKVPRLRGGSPILLVCRIESPPPISRLRRRDPASDVCSPRCALSRRGARPCSFQRLFAEGRDEGRTPFVDFCNRNVPRARPRFVRTPLHRAPGRPCVQLLSGPRSPCFREDVRAPGARVAACPVRRRALARRREGPCHRCDPAALPRCYPRETEAQDRSQPRGHGSGAAHDLANETCRRLPSRSLAPEASPQPDRLEHLLSLARCPRSVETVRGSGACSAPSVDSDSSSPGDAAA
jgi:hypothetical protein